jgi:hypothetical protein
MQIGSRRDPGLVLLFIVMTCGLYYLYFIYKVSQETQEFLREPDIAPGIEVLLSMVTCGLWNIYWDYRMGKRMARMCLEAGLPVTDNAVLYLVLDLVGFGGFASIGLINPVLQQETLNRIWQAAMTKPSSADSPAGAWPPPPQSTPTPRWPRPPQE